MVYTGQAPPSAFFTAPQRLSGSSAFWMSLAGSNPDGTSNGFGDALGWIPGLGLAQQIAAQKLANSSGLTDVQKNVADNMDNKIAKLQAGLGVAQAIGGIATANPGLVASGIGGTLSGVAGGISADAADKAQQADKNRRITYRPY